MHFSAHSHCSDPWPRVGRLLHARFKDIVQCAYNLGKLPGQSATEVSWSWWRSSSPPQLKYFGGFGFFVRFYARSGVESLLKLSSAITDDRSETGFGLCLCVLVPVRPVRSLKSLLVAIFAARSISFFCQLGLIRLRLGRVLGRVALRGQIQ